MKVNNYFGWLLKWHLVKTWPSQASVPNIYVEDCSFKAFHLVSCQSGVKKSIWIEVIICETVGHRPARNWCEDQCTGQSWFHFGWFPENPANFHHGDARNDCACAFPWFHCLSWPRKLYETLWQWMGLHQQCLSQVSIAITKKLYSSMQLTVVASNIVVCMSWTLQLL